MDSVAVKFAGLERTFDIAKTLIEFELFGNTISIKWYGAIIAFGFTLAVLFGGRIAYTWRINLDKMVDILIYGTFCGVIGARLYYVTFEWDYYSQHLGEIVQIWNGGLAIYGGIIGGLIGAFITCKIEKINFWNLLDMAGMSLLIGQGIGRWGNFANQEAFGTFTDKPWGMMSDTVVSYIQKHPDAFGFEGMTSTEIAQHITDNDLYVHPTFLYESIWCLLGFFVLFIILKKFRKFSGQLFLTYGLWYGLERAIVEGLRTDSLYIGDTGLRVSQLISIALAAVCFVALVVLTVMHTKNPKPIEGVDYFPEGSAKMIKEIKAEKAAAKAAGIDYRQMKKEEQKKAKREKVVIHHGKIVRDDRKKSEKAEVSENENN